MRSHFDAIKALLAPLGRPVYVVAAPGSVAYPYFILWGLVGALDSVDLEATQDTVSDLLRVTCVGETPEAAMELQRLSRAALIDHRPVVAGRTVHELRMVSAEQVMPDRDVTLPNTNRNPFYGVDIYRLISEPSPTTT